MEKRTFIDKTNTIFSSSNENYGLHPICMLNYGIENSRFLVHFDIDEINGWLKDKSKKEECKHFLKMTNCGSIDEKKYGLKMPSEDTNGEKQRAVSFTLYAFPIEEEWDEGIGFDSESNFWLTGHSCVSTEGSNWNNRKSGCKWLKNGCIGNYPNILEAIASQKFDHGNENLELDITDYVNKVLNGEIENNGLCIIFDPELSENTESKYTQYVGFFSNKTNTFFEPVVESRIDDAILDDRYDFTIGMQNRLYLYCCSEGEFFDLDHNPTCTIDGADVIDVVKQDKGIYYANVYSESEPDTILYDIWSDIVLNDGTKIDDIEMEFVTHPLLSIFNIGPEIKKDEILEPSLSGMNDNEKIGNEDIRKIDIKFRVPYSTKYKTLYNSEYRIYSKDNGREITIIDWDKVNNAGVINYFLIKGNEFVPGDYFVDIKVKSKFQSKVFKECLKFEKKNDITLIRR